MNLNFQTITASADPAVATSGTQMEQAFNGNFEKAQGNFTELSEGKAAVSHRHSYSDLTGTPAIPAVNNPTITLQQGGVTKGTFTLNQTTAQTINLDAGGSTGGGGVTVVDSLTSTSTSAALSANQGRILNSKIDNLIQAFATEAAAQAASAANPTTLCVY
jgi:hypothetical protein